LAWKALWQLIIPNGLSGTPNVTGRMFAEIGTAAETITADLVTYLTPYLNQPISVFGHGIGAAIAQVVLAKLKGRNMNVFQSFGAGTVKTMCQDYMDAATTL